jgi:hypothetical protein
MNTSSQAAGDSLNPAEEIAHLPVRFFFEDIQDAP